MSLSTPGANGITDYEAIHAAVATLSRSERGRKARADLLRFLENGGVSLDHNGRAAVVLLIQSTRVGTVLEALRCAELDDSAFDREEKYHG